MSTPAFTSNFHFLAADFPLLFNLGESAEYYLHSDSAVSLVKQRQFGERVAAFLMNRYGIAPLPDNSFHNQLKELKYQRVLPLQVADLLFLIKDKGNKAAHDSRGTVAEAEETLMACFRVGQWMAKVHGGSAVDISVLTFVPPPNLDARRALTKLEKQYKELEAKLQQLQTAQPVLAPKAAEMLKAVSLEVANSLELTEAETRRLIDNQLRAAGWEVDTQSLRFSKGTRPVKGRNLAIAEWPAGNRKADYALFIGLELYGIVEAKKHSKDVVSDMGQPKTYVSLVEEIYGAKLLAGQPWGNYRVPFLFTSNGRPYLEQIKTKSGIWLLDGRKPTNHPYPLQGWYSPEGLQKLFEQDLFAAETKLKSEAKDYLSDPAGLGLREYQLEAIEAVESKVLKGDEDRRALIAMATGTGKTRTIIGLCYRLLKAKRFRRILFLVDRSILGQQAADSFHDVRVEDLQTFADIYDIKDLVDKKPDLDTKMHFATVQGLVKRLFYAQENGDVLPVDTYDCIIVDEAHRGYTLDRNLSEEDLDFKDQREFQSQYRRVLEYFDAFRIGLTATPALHTTEIFGKPVYRYTYRQAVLDGYLIDHEPPFIIQTKLNQEGVKWEKGARPTAFDRSTGEIVELDELEDEMKFEVDHFNKQVVTEAFNRTVAGQLVQYLDPESKAKTLIFAATDEHADMVVSILKEEFEAVGIEVDDDAIQKITGSVDRPQEKVKRFKNENLPSIVVTVDLLTTGVDVPQICNLVFLRRVRSRILYEQMLGRATRRADEIGKETFRVYDAVRLYEALEEVSTMKPIVVNPTATFSQLVAEMDSINSEERLRLQLEQIIAKLQRKKRHLNGTSLDHFTYHAGGKSPDEVLKWLRQLPSTQGAQYLRERKGLIKFLDEMRGVPAVILVSDHADEYRATVRGYGNAHKPEDYLDSFRKFVQENQNKMLALQLVCTRPKELTRKALKELKLTLDEAGFNVNHLNVAYRELTNQDIAADIIAHIRTHALGDALISHEERIKRTILKIKTGRQWNAVQLRWLDRMEAQLIKEDILDREAFNQEPFKGDGGYQRVNKIFENKLDLLLDSIQDNLYNQPA